MAFVFQKLGTKLRLALLATAVLSVAGLTLAALPILRDSIRKDRIRLFVESSTRALAENVSHALEQYHGRVRSAASGLALIPANLGRREPPAEALHLLNRTAWEPVPELLPQGIFDLLVVVDRDGTILFTNTQGRFGQRLNAQQMWGLKISEFPEEEKIWRAAQTGTGKHDWYRSDLVWLVRPARGEDVARQNSIAFAEPIPSSGRVLIGIINWEAIQRILDRVEAPLARVGFPSGYAFMFARDGETIIAHKLRDPAKSNLYGTSLVRDHGLPGLAAAVREGKLSLSYEYPAGSSKVSGLSRIDDAELGWTVGLGINDADVVAPMRKLTWLLGLLALGLVLLALALSHFLSQRITVDLRELTASAQRIASGRVGERVAVRSGDEVGQLATAFNQMTAALVRRDEVILQQQQELMERMRIDQELRIAAAVQQRLFPQFRPPLRTIEYMGLCQPARTVSGDYYDFLALAPDKLGLMLADVCGKGLSAALLMASLHACVRTHAPLLGERCGEVIAIVNALLFEATDPDHFATMLYAVYDDATGRLTYVNAGHHPALLVRNGYATPVAAAAGAGNVAAAAEHVAARKATSLWLDFGVPPVGMFETLPAVQETVQLERGDWLVLYSDGIPETMDDKEEEFGRERLLDVVARNGHATADEMGQAILTELAGYSGGRPALDDRTLIVARVL